MEARFPKNAHDALQRSKDTLEILNEFREPTAAVATQSAHSSFSPLTQYGIYFILLTCIVIGVLYIWFKSGH